jgi:hypothetical protein
MSGPVWRKEPCEGCICDECLRPVDVAYILGTVSDATFRPLRILCEDCYEANKALILKKAS